jgi:hypothetical protein
LDPVSGDAVVAETVPQTQPPMRITKLSSSGNQLWQQQLDVTEIQGLTIDHAGSIYLMAPMDGTVDVGNGPLPLAEPYQSVLIAKLTGGGRAIWSKELVGRYDQDAGMATMHPDAGATVFYALEMQPMTLDDADHLWFLHAAVGAIELCGDRIEQPYDRWSLTALEISSQ